VRRSAFPLSVSNFRCLASAEASRLTYHDQRPAFRTLNHDFRFFRKAPAVCQ
jgi:hypothetical protein